VNAADVRVVAVVAPVLQAAAEEAVVARRVAAVVKPCIERRHLAVAAGLRRDRLIGAAERAWFRTAARAVGWPIAVRKPAATISPVALILAARIDQVPECGPVLDSDRAVIACRVTFNVRVPATNPVNDQ
jgi:hypothetical protein